jgi:RNA polymerase sigma-70 factor (ECF subfamily)
MGLLTLYFQTRDAATFTKVYETYFPRLVGWLRTRIPDDLAEDIAQQVFAKFWETKSSFEVQNDMNFIIQCARARVGRHFKQDKRMRSLNPEGDKLIDESENVEEEAIANEEFALRRNKLLAEIAGFPDHVQEIILLKDEGFSSREIGNQIGRPSDTVRTILARYKRRMNHTFLAI